MEFQNIQVTSDVPWQWYPLQVQGPASGRSEPHVQRLTTSGDTSTVPLVSSTPALPSIWLTSASTPMASIRVVGLRSRSTENVLSGDRRPGCGVGKVRWASATSSEVWPSTSMRLTYSGEGEDVTEMGE